MPTQIQTRLEIPLIDIPQQVSVFSLVQILFPSVQRSKALLPALLQKQYRAPAHTAAELAQLFILLKDLLIFLSSQPQLWCDNILAISLSSNPVFHARTKHIEVDYHFFRKKVLQKLMVVRYVTTQDQLANIFTKGLHPRLFQLLRSKLQVDARPISLKGTVNQDN